MSSSKKFTLVIAIAAIGVVGYGIFSAGQVLAAQQDVRPDIISQVAQRLGINPDDLNDAVDLVHDEMIDLAVEDGKITPDRAELLKDRDVELFFGPHMGRGTMHRHIDEIAQFLGLDREELIKEIGEYETLADLAEANGVTAEDLIEFLQNESDQRVDELADSGRITDERAESIKDIRNEKIEEFVYSGPIMRPSEGKPMGPMHGADTL